MSPIPLDFGKVAPLPEDVYLFVVSEITYQEPPAGARNDKGELKAPYLNMRADVVEGEYENKAVFEIFSLSEKALFRLQAFLQALTGDPWDEMAELEPSDLLGMTFKGLVEHQTYTDKKTGQDKVSAKLSSFFPSDYDPYAPDFVRDKENED